MYYSFALLMAIQKNLSKIILCPKVSDIGLLETYRAEEAIRAGYKCCEANIAAIKDAIGH